MPINVTTRVGGTTDLRKLGKAIRAASDKQLRVDLAREIHAATEPVHREVQESARLILPHEGGLNELIADVSTTTKILFSGKRAGVRIVSTRSKAQHRKARRRAVARRLKRQRISAEQFAASTLSTGLIDLPRLDKGMAKHPTFGKAPWHVQRVRPGFFTNVMRGRVATRVSRNVRRAVFVHLQKIDQLSRR